MHLRASRRERSEVSADTGVSLGGAQETELPIGWFYSLLQYICLLLNVIGRKQSPVVRPTVRAKRGGIQLSHARTAGREGISCSSPVNLTFNETRTRDATALFRRSIEIAANRRFRLGFSQRYPRAFEPDLGLIAWMRSFSVSTWNRLVVHGERRQDTVALRAEELVHTAARHVADVGHIQIEWWNFQREPRCG